MLLRHLHLMASTGNVVIHYMYAIILCGGSGTRLWPLSRKNYPKQFLKLYSSKSLLQETFLRIKEVISTCDIFFVTNNDNYFNVLNHVKEIEADFCVNNIIIEPASLNTAPAISIALKHLTEQKGINVNEPIIVLPSDHYIKDNQAYFELLDIASKELGDNIATIGITPTCAETGYGYIKKGFKVNNHYKVTEFKEKPEKHNAEVFSKSGEYVWNAGMYMFSADSFTKELSIHAPEIYKLFNGNYDEFRAGFHELPDVSIDYAISEKSNKVIVFEGDFGWTDIGSFDALSEVALNNKNIISHNSKNIFSHSENDRLIATIGVDDLIIIETHDSILVQKKGESSDVKQLVNKLKKGDARELEHNIIVHRPWGKYEVLMDRKKHKAKKITVYPGEKLSLQAHFHRAEHWIVVTGIAKIVNGEREETLKENESTFIPAYTKHRLENPGKINLEIIEIQTGSYLEEDDIIRYEDVYNR